jgi:D-glycero-D-manno-heptose 1,7-bisphosphate phosphatase
MVIDVVGAVFLDRDGVVNAATVRNGKPYPPGSVGDVEILPGVVEAIQAFKSAGLATVVVTNQPDIARGITHESTVTAINEFIREQTEIEYFVVCPHDDSESCGCRKPRPGMIIDTAKNLGLDLRRSVMVGDRWRDIAAGQAAGVATVLIERGYDEQQASNPSLVVGELGDAVDWILEHSREHT